MRRKLAFLFVVAVVGSMLAGARLADAHQCPEPKHEGKASKKDECHETRVYDDWRPNYVPLFDLSNRDEEQRREAQRWREECADGDQERQQCAWYYGGSSGQAYDGTDDEDPPSRPNEAHVGFGASHCFLAEAAHDCDAHGDGDEFATHDSHGGATYLDVCLAENPDSTHCDDGLQDTQAGVTSVDHLTCPTGCMDEYHVVRPFDRAYTMDQMGDSQAWAEYVADKPETRLQRHLCGYEQHDPAC